MEDALEDVKPEDDETEDGGGVSVTPRLWASGADSELGSDVEPRHREPKGNESEQGPPKPRDQ